MKLIYFVIFMFVLTSCSKRISGKCYYGSGIFYFLNDSSVFFSSFNGSCRYFEGNYRQDGRTVYVYPKPDPYPDTCDNCWNPYHEGRFWVSKKSDTLTLRNRILTKDGSLWWGAKTVGRFRFYPIPRSVVTMDTTKYGLILLKIKPPYFVERIIPGRRVILKRY